MPSECLGGGELRHVPHFTFELPMSESIVKCYFRGNKGYNPEIRPYPGMHVQKCRVAIPCFLERIRPFDLGRILSVWVE